MFWNRKREPGVPSVSSAELVEALKLQGSNAPYILDVRTVGEFRQGHIPGAHLMPLGEVAGRLGELPKNRTVVTVCRSGHRSLSAAKVLVAAGFTVQNLQGGLARWPGPVVG